MLISIPLVIALAANKSDMYEKEEIEEKEGREYGKEVGAIFKATSAKNASGIDELFKTIGNIFINPSYEEDAPFSPATTVPVVVQERRETIQITRKSQLSNKKETSGCCN